MSFAEHSGGTLSEVILLPRSVNSYTLNPFSLESREKADFRLRRKVQGAWRMEKASNPIFGFVEPCAFCLKPCAILILAWFWMEKNVYRSSN
jgi:hypothetical protein